MLPADAEATIALAGSARLRAAWSPLLERLPEARGVVELVRSVTGFDWTSDAETRRSGLDPDRGPAAAIWGDAVLVVLPVRDESLAIRRLRLRLARLGVALEETGGDRVERFRWLRPADGAASRAGPGGPEVSLWAEEGLAFLCVGAQERCLRAPAGWDPTPVKVELDAPDAIAAGLIRNSLVVRIAEQAGLPVQKPGVATALALLQDLRWTLRLDRGVEVRAAAGPAGPPIRARPAGGTLPSRPAALLRVNIPAGLAQVLGRGAGGPALSAWGGEAWAAIASRSSSAAAPIPATVSEAIGRLTWAAAFRMRSREEALRVVSDWVGPAGLSPGPEGTARVRLPFVGLEAGLRLQADVVALGADSGRPEVPPFGSERWKSPEDPATLFEFVADPEALLDAAGAGRIEFVRHMVAAVQEVRARLAFESGRFSWTLRADLR